MRHSDMNTHSHTLTPAEAEAVWQQPAENKEHNKSPPTAAAARQLAGSSHVWRHVDLPRSAEVQRAAAPSGTQLRHLDQSSGCFMDSP